MAEERFTLRSAVYLFVFKDNLILLSKRLNTGWMDGKYSLISGHIDGNETVHAAMIREALEEAGIKISIRDLEPATVLHRKSTDREYMDFFFAVRKWKGVPVIREPEKCAEMKWFPLTDLPDNLVPSVKEALDNYEHKIPFSVSGWS